MADALKPLTRRECLERLENVPQHFWPPRPTRQGVETLRAAVARAEKAHTEKTQIDE